MTLQTAKGGSHHCLKTTFNKQTKSEIDARTYIQHELLKNEGGNQDRDETIES